MMDTELGAIVERVLAAEERRREAQIAFARAQIALLDRIRETMRREQARDWGDVTWSAEGLTRDPSAS